MAVKFLAGINLGKNELQNARVQNLTGANAPSSPAVGQIYFDTDADSLKVYVNNGGSPAWENIGEYTLPTASTSTLGGVKIDDSTIGISSGVISVKDGGIANAQISTSAGIALSKMANIADGSILGNNSGGAGAPTALNATNIRTMLNVADGADVGTVTSITPGNGFTSSTAITSSGTMTIGAGTGITVNTNDVAITAAQTGITSVLNTSLVIGRDADNDIDFSTDNEIVFRANGADQIKIQDGAIVPITDNDIDLGTSTKEFKNAYFDGTVTADSFSGPLNGNATSASGISADGTTDNAAHSLIFVGTGTAVKKDGSASDTLTYNPSTQTLSVKNITVAGQQTINDTTLINTANGIIFEGATADSNETTLIATDPTKDNTVTLADLGGHVALFDAAPSVTITATPAELNYVDGVTSNIQTQLDAKQATITGAATTIDDTNLSASRALISNGSGKVAVSDVTSTELGYLDGVTSAIQTQINAKGTMSRFQVVDGDGTSIAIDHDKYIKFVEGGGIDINFTDTTPGSSSDPYDLTFTVSTASATTAGRVELATDAETKTGTDTARATTPANVKAAIDDRSFVTTISGTGAKTNFVVTHNLGTRDCIVQVIDYGDAGTGATYETVYADVTRSGTNTVDIDFATAPSTSEDYRVLIYKVV